VTEFEIHPPNLGEHVLLHELNHRINNEFAAVIGAVSAAASRSNNRKVKAALTDVDRFWEFSFRRIIVTEFEIHPPNLGEHVLLCSTRSVSTFAGCRQRRRR
jgi:hypothetical protein